MTMPKCTGHSKRSGKPCKKDAMKGRQTCYFHSGSKKSGTASPNYKHGRYSKDLPTRMAAQYAASLTDTELLNLRDEISLVDARLNDILKRVDSGESGKLWGLLSGAFDDIKSASSQAELTLALNEAHRLVQRGLADYAAWGEIGSLMEQRRRLVDSEAKRLKDMQMMYSVEQGMLLVGAIVDILQKNIEDRNTLDTISRAITALVSSGADVIDAG
jgi:hypothetical protein